MTRDLKSGSGRLHLFLLTSFFGMALWSVLRPHDYPTWVMEGAAPVLGVAILAGFYRRFQFTDLVYVCLWLYGLLLLVGAHYTYSRNPLFNSIRDSLGLARNHYDRVVHFSQGFFLAMVFRELLLRTSPLRPGKWVFVLAVCICLALSAFFELLEWWTSLVVKSPGEVFLAMQGDVWDSHWDMFVTLIGATLSQLLFGRWHDRQLGKLGTNSGKPAHW